MHRLFADWYKQADLNPTAELLNTRWSGVEVVLEKLDPNMVLELTRVSFGLPEIVVASSETDGLANLMKEADVAFPMKANENLLRVLAGATLAQCIESKHAHATFAALCVVSASCQGLRSSPSVEELPGIARDYLHSEGQSVREDALSAPVLLPKFPKLEISSLVAVEIQDAPQNHWPQVQHNFQSLKTWAGQVSSAVQALSAGLTSTRNETSAAFTTNAERATLENRIKVLKEECDVLWWLFGEFSERFALPWKEHRANEMCLLIGEELAEQYAYFLPAPNTKAFLSRALSVMAPQEGKLNLQTAITNAPLEWVRCVLNPMKSTVVQAGAVTPFHSALLRRLDGNGPPADGHLNSDAELASLECAYQMLVETLLLELVKAWHA